MAAEPHPAFLPGQRIVFAGEEYIVVENYGASGLVHEPGRPQQCIRFAWVFEGEACRLASAPVTPPPT